MGPCSLQKHKVFFWLFRKDRVSTRDILRRRGMEVDSYTCDLCILQRNGKHQHICSWGVILPRPVGNPLECNLLLQDWCSEYWSSLEGILASLSTWRWSYWWLGVSGWWGIIGCLMALTPRFRPASKTSFLNLHSYCIDSGLTKSLLFNAGCKACNLISLPLLLPFLLCKLVTFCAL
jgi:hypothetical protein